MRNVDTITLSYTFFAAKLPKAAFNAPAGAAAAPKL